MDICLSLVVGASLLARLPSPITLRWRHSVEHVLIEEQWEASGQGLLLVSSSTDGLGAGIDVPAEASVVGGRWTFRPALAPQREVQLANSRFAAGYVVCWPGACAPLSDIAGGQDRVVRMAVCAAQERSVAISAGKARGNTSVLSSPVAPRRRGS